MKVKSPETIVLAITMVMTAVSIIWFGSLLMATEGDTDYSQPAARMNYESGPALEPMTLNPTVWPEPLAQSKGHEWIYDVFTPPVIYYDTVKQDFRVFAKTGNSRKLITTEENFGLELLEVRHEEYPLQLVGYVGEAGNFYGVFQNLLTSEILLLSPGDKLDSLELSILDLRVEQKAVTIPESMTINEYQATAQVLHDRSGEIVILKQGVKKYTNVLIARCSITSDPPTVLFAKEGEVITREDIRYIIGKIRLAPSSIDVTKEHAPKDSPLIKTLLLKPYKEQEAPR